MDNVKICPKCGKENDRYFVACGKCGAPLVDDSVTGEETAEKERTAAENKIAKLLKIIANIVYVAAFFVGLIRLFSGDGFVIPIWLGGFISGTVFLGFSEIIRLLHEINQKTKEY